MPSSSRKTSASSRARLLLVAAVGVIALSVWGVSQIQRSSADRSFTQTRSAERMLTAMLDQETGVRGFALARREDFLAPFEHGTAAFGPAATTARRSANASGQRALVQRQVAIAMRWHRLVAREITQLRRHPGQPLDLNRFVSRKRLFDRFRRANAALQANVAAARVRQVGRSGLLSVASSCS